MQIEIHSLSVYCSVLLEVKLYLTTSGGIRLLNCKILSLLEMQFLGTFMAVVVHNFKDPPLGITNLKE